jgi:aminoglycoside phosphotransferase (APT) family kinase protein
MEPISYSRRLGEISPRQFQRALDQFDLGTFVQAKAIPFGLFGQNVFVTSTKGEFVLRGNPHFHWQFPTEQFYVQQLHEQTAVPVPYPYLLDEAPTIFGWSYVLMPRMRGLQVTDQQIKETLTAADRTSIARALGENLSLMQELTWPTSGRYQLATQTIRPFELRHELAYPFPVALDTRASALPPQGVTFPERVVARIRHLLWQVSTYNDRTSATDVAWVEEVLEQAQDALDNHFQPCFLMQDYKEANVVLTNKEGRWSVSGVFDLMEGCFGDGEADLSRPVSMYMEEESGLAREFVQAFLAKKPLRAGFKERFPIYMLHDRLIVWEYVQRTHPAWWSDQLTFRHWVEPYLAAGQLIW